jgi:hypothetical protein
MRNVLPSFSISRTIALPTRFHPTSDANADLHGSTSSALNVTPK